MQQRIKGTPQTVRLLSQEERLVVGDCILRQQREPENPDVDPCLQHPTRSNFGLRSPTDVIKLLSFFSQTLL